MWWVMETYTFAFGWLCEESVFVKQALTKDALGLFIAGLFV